ncbi:MAG: hypothetical protein ACD_12C00666G0004 [uncultured bacterium]|nr:MAG: hypothetical protein ACD_12C00666G0004 [uncultured bacterium]
MKKFYSQPLITYKSKCLDYCSDIFLSIDISVLLTGSITYEEITSSFTV